MKLVFFPHFTVSMPQTKKTPPSLHHLLCKTWPDNCVGEDLIIPHLWHKREFIQFIFLSQFFFSITSKFLKSIASILRQRLVYTTLRFTWDLMLVGSRIRMISSSFLSLSREEVHSRTFNGIDQIIPSSLVITATRMWTEIKKGLLSCVFRALQMVQSQSASSGCQKHYHFLLVYHHFSITCHFTLIHQTLSLIS